MNSEAYPAFLVYKYKNTKVKLIKASSNIEFNKKCLHLNLIPRYAVVNIKNKSRAAQIAKRSAERIWIKKEIDHLYAKKIRLNSELYRIHLELLNALHPAICNSVFDKVEQQIQSIRYKIFITHKKKLCSLQHEQRTTVDIVCKHKFYKRIANLTDMNLTNDEETLLNKGLKYNLPTLNTSHAVHDVINAEAAIKSLQNDNTQNEARVMINNKLNRLLNMNTQAQRLERKYRNDRVLISNLRKRLVDNNIVLLKADKGNTAVLLHKHAYLNKVQDFITNNDIDILTDDPTKRYVKDLNAVINKCTNLFDERTRRYLKPIHAQAPLLTGLPKIHKTDIPIRPLVNFMTAPCYKIAKILQKIIKNNTTLQNNHSVINSSDFVNRIKDVSLKPQYKIASFDIVNLYTNVPVHETVEILKTNLIANATLSPHAVNELIMLLKEILRQNYFTFNNVYYSQKDGLSMGSPLSGILSDLYLNFFESEYLFSSSNKYRKNIVSYFRYVDDTFIIFDGSLRQIELLKNYLNGVNKRIQLTLETEKNNQLNFLDLTIIKFHDSFKFKIYRKPTTTDTTIHALSYHPWPQKMAAYNAFVHRLLTVPLEQDCFTDEVNTLKHIAISNGYDANIIDILISRHKNKPQSPINTVRNNVKYVSAEYTSLLPNILRNRLKKYNVTVIFRTRNNIENALRPRIHRSVETRSGVYKLTCDDCHRFYIGQTGRRFEERYKEHLPMKNGINNKSAFAQHLIDYDHNYTNFAVNFKPLHFCMKGRYMNALEEFEIYKAAKTQKDCLLNDVVSFRSNALFDTIIQAGTSMRDATNLSVH